MIAGRWQQHELWDGTYTLQDWMDCMEIMAVEAENQARALEAAKKGGDDQ